MRAVSTARASQPVSVSGAAADTGEAARRKAEANAALLDARMAFFDIGDSFRGPFGAAWPGLLPLLLSVS
jgi:hypothetical protein